MSRYKEDYEKVQGKEIERKKNLKLFKIAIGLIGAMLLVCLVSWSWNTHSYLNADVEGKLVKIYHAGEGDNIDHYGVFEFPGTDYVVDDVYISDRDYAKYKALGTKPSVTRNRSKLEKRRGMHFLTFLINSFSILGGIFALVAGIVFGVCWCEENF